MIKNSINGEYFDQNELKNINFKKCGKNVLISKLSTFFKTIISIESSEKILNIVSNKPSICNDNLDNMPSEEKLSFPPLRSNIG